MKNKQGLMIGALIVLVVITATFIFKYNQKKVLDPNSLPRCSQQDREKNNCVPTGRCTPIGDPRESTIDCEIKNYDHKFDIEL